VWAKALICSSVYIFRKEKITREEQTMKAKTFVAIALLLALVSATACTAASAGTPDQSNQDTKEIAITASDEFDQNKHMHKEVGIAQGEKLVVTLISNATTGFSWDENAQIAETGIIKQLDHEFIGAETNLPGAPSAEQWTFEAIKAGTDCTSGIQSAVGRWGKRRVDI
jgi:inhibitor of cysteine peptidase